MNAEMMTFQKMLDGGFVKTCTVTVRTGDGATFKARISGPQAHEVVEAVVRIVCKEDKE